MRDQKTQDEREKVEKGRLVRMREQHKREIYEQVRANEYNKKKARAASLEEAEYDREEIRKAIVRVEKMKTEKIKALSASGVPSKYLSQLELFRSDSAKSARKQARTVIELTNNA